MQQIIAAVKLVLVALANFHKAKILITNLYSKDRDNGELPPSTKPRQAKQRPKEQSHD